MSSRARAASRRSVPWNDGLGIICTCLFQKPLYHGKHFFGRDFVAIGGEVQAIALKIMWRQSNDFRYGGYVKLF
jgi:hypothetical protein